MVLSGAVQYDIEWDDDDMSCGGHGGNTWINVDGEQQRASIQNAQFEGVPAGASSQVDLVFNIRVDEGATGAGLPGRVNISDRGSGRVFATPTGVCTFDVTEQSLIDENPAFSQYRLVASGSCSEPAVQHSPGPGAGEAAITIGDFEFAGIAVWM